MWATAAALLALSGTLVGSVGVASLEPVRPGHAIGVPAACTLNFMFRDGGGVVFFGTAAHCVHGIGDEVRSQYRGRIGEVALVDRSIDFALVRLDPGVPGKPEMLGAPLAPTGTATQQDLQTGDVLRMHGHGVGVGLAVQTRTRDGVLVGKDSTTFWWDTVATPGDSGAPVVEADTGKAVGMVSRLGAERAATDLGPRVPAMLAAASARGLHLTLATAGT